MHMNISRYLQSALAVAVLLLATPHVRAQVTYQLDGWPPNGATNYEIFNNSVGTETEDCWVANSFRVIAGGNVINSVSFALGNAQPSVTTLTVQVTVALYTGSSLTSPAGIVRIVPATNTVTLTNVPTGSLQTVAFGAPTTLPTGQIFYAAILIREVTASIFPFVDDMFTPPPSPTNQLRSFFDVGPTMGGVYNLDNTANARRLGLSHPVLGGPAQSAANLVLRVNATPLEGKIFLAGGNSAGEVIRSADPNGANSTAIWPNGGRDVAINTITGNIYWTVNSPLPGKLMTGASDGTGSASLVATTVPGERMDFIAIDPTGTGTAYWCDFTAGHFYRAVLPNGTPTLLSLSVNGPHGIALDLRPGKIICMSTTAPTCGAQIFRTEQARSRSAAKLGTQTPGNSHWTPLLTLST